MSKKVKVFLDMDGVLSDFSTQYKKINGVTPRDVYIPGQSERSAIRDTYWNSYVDQKGFVNAPPMHDSPDLIKGITDLMNEGKISKVEICTSAGGKERMDDVIPQKKEWLFKHYLNGLTAHITQSGKHKADYVDPNYTCILIDDTQVVIDYWIKAGGIGILHTSAESSLKQLREILDNMTAKMIKSPQIVEQSNRVSIFMAGSIEMGKAEDWQTKLFNLTSHLDIDYYNPRRDDWDSSWVQEKSNSQFSEQVNWELAHLICMSDYQIFVFDPNTTSPITLLELGLVLGQLRKHSVIGVVCPRGYFRKGNVDIVCERYHVPVVESIEELARLIEFKMRDTVIFRD